MAYDEKRPAAAHAVSLTERDALTVSGVESVGSFDESVVEISTSRGLLVVRGSGLEMEQLNTDTGEMIVRGSVDSLEYEGDKGGKDGFFARLFR